MDIDLIKRAVEDYESVREQAEAYYFELIANAETDLEARIKESATTMARILPNVGRAPVPASVSHTDQNTLDQLDKMSAVLQDLSKKVNV